MRSYIIDTNFFINLQRPLGWGSTKEEVASKFVETAHQETKNHHLLFLTTPSSFKELEGFFENSPTLLQGLKTALTIASPSITQLSLSAVLFHELVAETGKRLYKGLRAAEEPLKKALQQTQQVTQDTTQLFTHELRNKYRRATREGFLDSTTDLELILLAREKDAQLVTSDQGVLIWGRRFGCKEILPEDFIKQIERLTQPDNTL